jgi:molybdopterin molybdotransferase
MDDGESVSRSIAVERLLDLRAGDGSASMTRVGLADVAGRVLAESVRAPADVPAYDRAAMDGYAFAARDDYPLAVVGSVSPEDEPPTVERGEAVAVATGAPLPPRANAVLMEEHATVEDGRLSGPPATEGTHVTRAGTTAAAGERLFERGQRLASRHAALLRDVGIENVTVREPLDVGVLATGTEICEGRQPDRDSEMLCNLVRRWGHDPTLEDPVPDAPAAVREAITAGAAAHDVLVTTGGTSVGRGDHVVSALRDHDVLFRGVDLRPGRPVTVATVDGTPTFALPGKPIAAHTAATLLLGPFLTGVTGRPTVTAELAARVTLPDDEMEFAIPVTLADGLATPLGHADSSLQLYDERFSPGRVASNTRVALADGVVVTREAIDEGEQVSVVPHENLA